ncbi:MAG: hypothetical protein AVDCRST_MAG49-2481, partial [uncultured Thermomicrobiales bacterium]
AQVSRGHRRRLPLPTGQRPRAVPAPPPQARRADGRHLAECPRADQARRDRLPGRRPRRRRADRVDRRRRVLRGLRQPVLRSPQRHDYPRARVRVHRRRPRSGTTRRGVLRQRLVRPRGGHRPPPLRRAAMGGPPYRRGDRSRRPRSRALSPQV